jgi:hypothetical protein
MPAQRDVESRNAVDPPTMTEITLPIARRRNSSRCCAVGHVRLGEQKLAKVFVAFVWIRDSSLSARPAR